MRTDTLYTADSYLRVFRARVLEARADSVVLDRTAFYPTGGGQPHDLGTLATHDGHAYRVISVAREGAAVVHTIDGELPGVGTVLKGEIDWQRRYALMRTHTALHVLSGVVWRDHGAKVTGGSMEPLHGHLDFELERLEPAMAEAIVANANLEIAAAREVSVRVLPRAEALRIPDLIRTKVDLLPPGLTEIRIVDIRGLDLQADGGTHVANTREVGTIRLLGTRNKGKANKRLEIAVQ
jgi:misacylated tRNA(Ala) deacylase